MEKNDKHWVKIYQHYDFFQNQIKWYRETISFHVKNMTNCTRILDTGAGSGNLTIELARVQNRKLVAIDSEQYALEQLRQKNFLIETILGDVQNMSFSNDSFDGITSMFLLPFVDDYQSYFSEVFRILKDNGVFSISLWAPNQRVGDTWVLRDLIEEELIQKGILPRYQKEWDELLEVSFTNAKNIDNRKLYKDQVLDLLKETGFKDIWFLNDNPYHQYAYFITAKK